MLLKELLHDIDFSSGRDLPHIAVNGLSCDSRTVKSGFVFFAVSGTRESGLKYAEEAQKNGAVAIVHDAESRLDLQIPCIRVKQVRPVMCRAAATFYGQPSRDFYLSGVTGTNGKTTFTYLMESFARPKKSGVIGTVKIRYADQVLDTSHTTPDAITLQELFARMKAAGVVTVAMEVSSHALDQCRAHASHFDSAVFTNLTQDHLDFHQNMENYFQAKLKLFTECLTQSEKTHKRAVINLDSPYGKRIIEILRGTKDKNIEITTYSCHDKNATVALDSAQYSFEGTDMKLIVNGKSFSCHSNLIGNHNIQNIMAALLVGLHQKMDLDEMAARLAKVSVPGRLERVAGKNFFVDYAHSPDALENVIRALQNIRQQQQKPGRLIVLFGCGGDRDQGKRPQMGEIAAKMADVVLVTSDNPRTEDPLDIISDILDGVVEHQDKFDGERGYLTQVDRESALEEAVKLARPEDIVLIAGKGHEDYQIIGTEKRYFDDREVLASLLK